MSALCPICKQIPFRRLTSPTASELRSVHEMQKKGLRFHPYLPLGESLPGTRKSDKDVAEEDARTYTELGPLGKVKARASHCQLCSLFYNVIQRRGAYYINNRPIPEDDDNIVIVARHNFWHSSILEIAGGTAAKDEELFNIHRLSLVVYCLVDTEIDGVVRMSLDALAYYPNVVQSCHIDDFEQPPSGSDPGTIPGWQPRLLFSARKRPKTVDIQLLQRWIKICQTEHDLSCSFEEDEQRPPSDIGLIRFIDVDQNSICVMRDVDLFHVPYLALSYCWGSDQKVKLDVGNEGLFQKSNGLPSTDIPQTIQDSILLARLLGFRYLWVDVLCIFQGHSEADQTDRAVQLGNMGKIYRESNVTIIAACGDTADAGLIGLRPNSCRSMQEIVQVIDPDEDPVHGGLALVSSCNSSRPWTGADPSHTSVYSDEEVERSAWNTRGWTFQERALSRRCLIFTPEQVRWCCDGGIFCEESHYEPPNLYEHGLFDMPLYVRTAHQYSPLSIKTVDGPLALLTTNRRAFWDRFSESVEAFSRRQMTCEGDVYDAFRGLLEGFTSISGESFHWGHPLSRFEQSLMWNCTSSKSKLYRRTGETTLPLTSPHQTAQIPSWSWMGWVGPTHSSVRDYKVETERSEITCFYHSTSPLRITRIHGSNRFDPEPDKSDADFQKSQPKIPPPPWKPHNPPKHTNEDPEEEKTRPITIQTVQKHLPSLPEPYLQQTAPPGHILFFWTSSVLLHVQRPPDHALHSNLTASFTGTTIKGTIVDPAVADKGKAVAIGTVDTMGLRHWDGTPDPSGLHEFVAVGRRFMRDVFLPGGEITTTNVTEGKGNNTPASGMVLALQVRRDEQTGVAERVNFGEIEEGAWMAAGPVWKLVALM